MGQTKSNEATPPTAQPKGKGDGKGKSSTENPWIVKGKGKGKDKEQDKTQSTKTSQAAAAPAKPQSEPKGKGKGKNKGKGDAQGLPETSYKLDPEGWNVVPRTEYQSSFGAIYMVNNLDQAREIAEKGASCPYPIGVLARSP